MQMARLKHLAPAIAIACALNGATVACAQRAPESPSVPLSVRLYTLDCGPELAAARSRPPPFGVDPAQIAPLDQATLISTDGDYDIFGDGTVKTLKTPGHTPGHHSLIVKLPKSDVLLITGDLYHTRLNYEKGLVPRINDRPNTQASMNRFAGIKANTNARIVIQHAPEDFASMPAFPKFLD
jgi:N-acyl homoserine lactone hydrolase